MCAFSLGNQFANLHFEKKKANLFLFQLTNNSRVVYFFSSGVHISACVLIRILVPILLSRTHSVGDAMNNWI